MASFQYFQNQSAQSQSLSLSVILQYAENARKQSFEALCRMSPLVKSYRDKVEETMRAMVQADSTLAEEAEIPPVYTAAFTLVKESFKAHLGALDESLGVFAQGDESQSDKVMADVRQSGQQLESALNNLSTNALKV